jgi:hypothetical protein
VLQRAESDSADAVAARRARQRQAGNERVRRSAQAWRAALRDGPVSAHTPAGEVLVLAVDTAVQDGVERLEVRTAPGSEETHFRIFNPPTGVRRGGTVVEDPIGALVETLAMHGGARQVRRTR